MNSSIDTENGYTYNGGRVLALCPKGGMTNEVNNCRNFSSSAAKKTMNVKNGQIITVKSGGESVISLTLPCDLSAYIVYLGDAKAVFETE